MIFFVLICFPAWLRLRFVSICLLLSPFLAGLVASVSALSSFCEGMFSPAYAPVAFLMLNRPLAIGSAGGGLVSAFLYCLENTFREPHLPQVAPLFDELCQCGATVRVFGFEVEVRSLIIGLVLGFFLGPLVEVLSLVRQWWSYQLRTRFRLAVGGGSSRSYRVLE